MLRLRHSLPFWLSAMTLLAPAGVDPARADQPPAVRELRIQHVGTVIYFHVGFEAPPGLAVSQPQAWIGWPRDPSRELVRQPRLVPQDHRARAVYARLPMPENQPVRLMRPPRPTGQPVPSPNRSPRAAVPVVGLEFVGQCVAKGKIPFLLLYPTEEKAAAKREERPGAARRRDWVEVPVELDFARAQEVPTPGRKREPSQPPSRDDLEGLWASAQAARFTVLEALAPEFSFYGYARAATGRKYGVPAPSLGSQAQFPGNVRSDHARLYETTTGAAAVAESLQLERMLAPNVRDTGPRTIEVSRVPGIDIAEHPWQQMMGDKKPAPEPLARLVPYDNYYLHFKDIRKFIELGELLDQWGTSLARAYEIQSRDYQLRQRYERQLCLRSTALGKTLGPLVIRGLAVTGSDAYLREGSDLTVLFHVKNRGLFLAAVSPFLDEARREWGSRLQAGKEEYHGVPIENFITPLREVSLHRAVVGDFVIYSNSPVALRRVLDTYQGRSRALADAQDFRYMRTVFHAQDANEDGFLFLSDAFIRQLVGPASKIKEKRRLEALTSLYLATNDALFTAWETGKLPAAPPTPYASAVLRPEELWTPEGKDVAWDASRKLAVSDVYGTLHFATPLIELPLDRITATEESEYLRFRGEYLGLWRRYFDPVGMRLALGDRRVRVETYILPLVQNSQYNELRRRTGDGTTPAEVKGFSPRTVVQLVSHISPRAPERDELKGLLGSLGALGGNAGLDWLGDWFVIRLNDSAVYGRLARRAFERDLARDGPLDPEEVGLWFQVPLTVGVGIKNPLVFAGVLTGLRGAVNSAAPGAVTWEPLQPDYKGVAIVRIQAKRDGMLDRELNRNRKEAILPALYYANVEGGWYVSLRQDCIQEVIDRAAARKQGKLPPPETVPVNTSLLVAPGAVQKTRDFANLYLEWQTQRQALANVPYWYALYRTGLVHAKAPDDVRRQTARHYLGFVPVSPEGAPYFYDARTDEVINQRHGSLRRPQRHPAPAASLPTEQLLERLLAVRADLRFREDGVNTVLTIERRPK